MRTQRFRSKFRRHDANELPAERAGGLPSWLHKRWDVVLCGCLRGKGAAKAYKSRVKGKCSFGSLERQTSSLPH